MKLKYVSLLFLISISTLSVVDAVQVPVSNAAYINSQPGYRDNIYNDFYLKSEYSNNASRLTSIYIEIPFTWNSSISNAVLNYSINFVDGAPVTVLTYNTGSFNEETLTYNNAPSDTTMISQTIKDSSACTQCRFTIALPSTNITSQYIHIFVQYSTGWYGFGMRSDDYDEGQGKLQSDTPFISFDIVPPPPTPGTINNTVTLYPSGAPANNSLIYINTTLLCYTNVTGFCSINVPTSNEYTELITLVGYVNATVSVNIAVPNYNTTLYPFYACNYTSNLNYGTSNTNLNYTMGGITPWNYSVDYAHDGANPYISLKAPPLSNGQSSWVNTTVNGSAVLDWYWAIDSAGVDILRFRVDGTQYYSINSAGWQHKSYSIVGEGVHTVTFMYAKQDSTSNYGAWIDTVTISPPPNCYGITPTPTPTPTPTLRVTRFASNGVDFWFALFMICVLCVSIYLRKLI